MADIADAMDWLIEPDTMLPSQFYERSGSRSGEWRLVQATLEDALVVARYRGRDSRKIKAQIEAETWLMDDSWEPYSFNWCCDILKLGDDVRARIRRGDYDDKPLRHRQPVPRNNIITPNRERMRA